MAAPQRILFEIQVEDANLTAKIEQLRARIRAINRELKSNPGPERFAELADELSKSRRDLQELTKQQRDLNKEFQALKVPKDSLAGLRVEYSRLSQQVANLSKEERESDFGRNLIQQAARIKKEIDGVEQAMGRFTGNVGNYKSALSGLGTALAALGVGFSIGEIVNQSNLLADAVANVAKTTGLTVKEADRLRQSLEKIDTRTAVLELLKIAEIGGQIGIASDQIEDFTASVDKLAVALGDAFGGNIEELTRVIAGIRNSLADFRTDDAAADMLNLGNALNFLESQGAATAPVIADFVSRISGIAGPLNISADRVFGLATALAELNVTPERGATAISRLLVEISKAPGVFAQSLGLSSKETADFINLVQTDLTQALAFVSEKLAAGGDASKNFAQTLDEIGIGSQGAIEALGKIGQNTALLNERIAQSGEALKGTDSILEEFEKKNTNSAAAVEKLQKAFLQFITGENIQSAIEAIAKALTDLIEALDKVLQFVTDSSEEFLTLSGVMFAFSKPGAVASATLRSVALASQTATAATVRNTIATQAATVATRALAAVQSALPLLAIVAGIYAVVKAFEAYRESASATEKAVRRVAEAQREIAEASASEVAALEKNFAIISDLTLSKEQRAKAIDELMQRYPEYLKGLNLEIQSTDALRVIQKELTDEIIRSAAARAKARAQEEIVAKIVEQRLKVEEVQRRRREQREVPGLAQGFVQTAPSTLTIVDVETQKLRKLEEELEAVGRKFDETFGLDKPKRSSVIDIVDPKSLKAQADEAVAASQALSVGLSKQEQKDAEKAAAERKRRREEELRRIEAQNRRILELERSIRELSLQEEGKYARALEELEVKRIRVLEDERLKVATLVKSISERTGKELKAETVEQVRKLPDAKPADINEADLIEKETALALKALEKQRNEIIKERDLARIAIEEDVRKRAAEVLKIEAEIETSAATSALEDLQRQFEKRRKVVQQELEVRRLQVKELAAAGKITEAQAEERDVAIRIEVSQRLVQIENEYAQRVAEIVEQVRLVKEQAAKTELQIALDVIEKRRQAEEAAAKARAKDADVSPEAEIQSIREKAAAEALDAERKYADAVKQAAEEAKQIQLDSVDAVEAARQASHEAELERMRQRMEAEKEMRQRLLDIGSQAFGQLTEISRNNLQNETEDRLRAIDEEYEARKKRAGQNTKLVERLEKEQAAKRAEIERQAAQKRKQIAVIEAIINTALAVARVAYNPILAAATAALGALQIAVIQSQRFAEGGRVGKKREGKNVGAYPLHVWRALPDVSAGGMLRASGPKDDTGHRVAGKLAARQAVVHEGEYVAPAWMVRAMPDLFDAIEQMRLRRRVFHEGGFTFNVQPPAFFANRLQVGGFAAQPPIILPSQSSGAQAVTLDVVAEFTPEQIALIANRLAKENAETLRAAIAEGLNDANRRMEREAALQQRRTV